MEYDRTHFCTANRRFRVQLVCESTRVTPGRYEDEFYMLPPRQRGTLCSLLLDKFANHAWRRVRTLGYKDFRIARAAYGRVASRLRRKGGRAC